MRSSRLSASSVALTQLLITCSAKILVSASLNEAGGTAACEAIT